MHHPPYSLDTTHGGYPDIEIALDRVIQSTGRIPTAVLSGHVHSYQRFERALGDRKVPYIVAGAGGYANTLNLLHKIDKAPKGKALPPGPADLTERERGRFVNRPMVMCLGQCVLFYFGKTGTFVVSGLEKKIVLGFLSAQYETDGSGPLQTLLFGQQLVSDFESSEVLSHLP